MQAIIAGLISVFLLALMEPALAAKAKSDGVPTFDVASSCKAARAYAGDDKDLAYRGCMKDETDARAEMVKKWSRFKAADRQDCVAQGAEPMPSYVEILTCLEMSEQTGDLFLPSGAARGTKSPPPTGDSTMPSQLPPTSPNADSKSVKPE